MGEVVGLPFVGHFVAISAKIRYTKAINIKIQCIITKYDHNIQEEEEIFSQSETSKDSNCVTPNIYLSRVPCFSLIWKMFFEDLKDIIPSPCSHVIALILNIEVFNYNIHFLR